MQYTVDCVEVEIEAEIGPEALRHGQTIPSRAIHTTLRAFPSVERLSCRATGHSNTEHR